jgi:uncharacterized membrane protein
MATRKDVRATPGREDVRGKERAAASARALSGRVAARSSAPSRRDTEVPLTRFTESARSRGDGDERLANGLGWFSIGLGLAQILSPGGVARLIGLNDDAKSRGLMRAIGVREIATGVGMLSKPRPASWVRARVGGDVMDLTLLGAAMRSDDSEKGRVAMATAAVLGVTALDVMCSGRLSEKADGAATAGDRAGKVNVKRAVTIRKSREELYTFWRNFENLPRFMYHLEEVRVLGSGRSHWKAKAPTGTTVEWDAEVVEDRPNERIAWRSLPNADVPNWGSVEFRRAPGDRGTEVHVEIHYDPPGGKLGALIAKLFGEEPGEQVADDLRRLKQVMEVGEVIRSDASLPGPGPSYLAQRSAHPPESEARL